MGMWQINKGTTKVGSQGLVLRFFWNRKIKLIFIYKKKIIYKMGGFEPKVELQQAQILEGFGEFAGRVQHVWFQHCLSIHSI